jgi:RNA polymerase sigma-70 factor (ECF subfamily)
MTDEELILQFKEEASRESAFRQLVQKYQQRLYFHIRRMVIDHDDANDVLQNSLIKVWNNLANFREESQLFTWLYRIATNESLSFMAQKQRKFAFSIDEYQSHLANKLKSDKYFEGDKIELKLQQAILTLPEKQRLVFNMRYYDETPYEEMSRILGTSEGALKASYHLAAKKIEKIILEAD